MAKLVEVAATSIQILYSKFARHFTTWALMQSLARLRRQRSTDHHDGAFFVNGEHNIFSYVLEREEFLSSTMITFEITPLRRSDVPGRIPEILTHWHHKIRESGDGFVYVAPG